MTWIRNSIKCKECSTREKRYMMKMTEWRPASGEDSHLREYRCSTKKGCGAVIYVHWDEVTDARPYL